MYDVDLFHTSSVTMRALHAAGRPVVCCVSVGTWEPFREDAATLPDEAIGESVDGFEEERWVDVRRAAVRNLVMPRFAVASERGCDGVEPDNVDGYAKTPGSPSPLMTSWTSTVEVICREDPAQANCDRLEGWGQKGLALVKRPWPAPAARTSPCVRTWPEPRPCRSAPPRW